MSTTRKRKRNLIVSYKNLSDDLKDLFKEMYPDGYNNYLTKFVKPNGEPIFIVPLETDDTSYMVKFEVKIDSLAEDLDKALFDDDADDDKEPDYVPLNEAIEKEDGLSHNERVLRHGDFETTLEEEEQRRKKLTLGINKEEIKAAFADDEEADELDSYDKIGDDDEPEDDFEPSDDDIRAVEAEYLDAENPPLDAIIPDEEAVPLPSSKKTSTRKKTSKKK